MIALFLLHWGNILGQNETEILSFESYILKSRQAEQYSLDSAFRFCDEAYRIAKLGGDPYDEVLALMERSRLLARDGDAEIARAFHDSLLLHSRYTEDAELRFLLNLANARLDVIHYQGYYRGDVRDEVDAIAEKTKGVLEILRRDYSGVEEEYSKGRFELILATFHKYYSDSDSSNFYIEKCIPRFRQLGSKFDLSQAYALKASNLIGNDDSEELRPILDSLKTIEEELELIDVSITCASLISFYQDNILKDEPAAIAMREELHEKLMKYPLRYIQGDIMSNANVLFFMERNRGNFERALEWKLIANEAEVKGDLIESKDKLAELDKKYNIAVKDKEILELDAENRRYAIAAIVALAVLVVSILTLVNLRLRQREKSLVYERRVNDLMREQETLSMNAMLDGQQQERERVGRELHDSLGSLLANVRMQVSAAKENQTPESLFKLNKVAELVDGAVTETRRLSKNLLNGVLTEFGIVAALSELTENINASGIVRIRLNIVGMDSRMSTSKELNLYRIAQELTTNALKHANASEIVINLMKKGEEVILIVKDNGKGLDQEKVENAEGVGWENIKGRVNALQGSFKVQVDRGTKVTVKVPQA